MTPFYIISEGQIWCHEKSKRLYVVTGVVDNATNGLESRMVVTYHRLGCPVLCYARDFYEFTDGRFTYVDPRLLEKLYQDRNKNYV